MSAHTYESLQKMKGQAVKDIWHAMIGKPAGIKNTTGLKNGEEIIQAILKGQADPSYLITFRVRPLKQDHQTVAEEMPPKPVETKKRGPKPKQVVLPQPTVPSQAYETTEIPLKVDEVIRIVVRKLIVENTEYFLDAKTNKVYACTNGRAGAEIGVWNPETRELLEIE